MNHRIALGLVLAVCSSAAQADGWLHCGNLFDSEQGKLVGERYVHFNANKILAVTSDKPAADSVDLSDKTCLPGLTDLHVHLDGQSGPGAYLNRFTEGPADLAYTAQNYGMKTLLAGFTTVRNPGDSYNVTLALRDAIKAGKVKGPRIYSAGKSLATTGGHADPTNGVRPDLMGEPGPKQGVVNSPSDIK